MSKQNIQITVDAVIFVKEETSSPKVLLIQRKKDPFINQWALPGGFLENDELLEDGAKRELEEETGLRVSHLEQVGIFANPGRDPRGRIISIAFTTSLSQEVPVKASDDAMDAKWFNIKNLPETAFDHEEIIEIALMRSQKE
ncbi:NUDIX hydrolase [Antarcticibacterium arcticum]|uniref:NUDIX hydrolase n=1 Tax=Antarcticibacterium arcticum TaxID=2585771 RepID=A0A5B8YGQ2_9FLAO|nr:NUDIX hydrolase [Antarcticibacterium arcticum]QED37045.1 NUDIX hydrolase [Antarcticibacterium arcticum]